MTFIACLFLSLGMALAQTQVSGKVTSAEDGEPIIGASVKVVGTKTGAVTDVDGNFSLNAPAGAKLEISYIGMNSQTVKAGSNMKIVLNPDNKTLDEVVVTGYGNFKKSSFTGAAASMSTAKLSDVPSLSVEDKLSGNIPGVSISSFSGQHGARKAFITSVSSSSPNLRTGQIVKNFCKRSGNSSALCAVASMTASSASFIICSIPNASVVLASFFFI